MKLFNLFLAAIILSVSCEHIEQRKEVNRPVKIIAHRGVHKYLPENTLASFRAAMDRQLDYIEMDVRTTADGYLVLMHDKTVDRTTTGTGVVAKMKVEQIRGVDAGVKKGPTFAGEMVPFFDEALKYVKGRIGVYVDIKDADPLKVLEMLEKNDMLDSAVIYADDETLLKIVQKNPAAPVMPEVRNEEDLQRVMRTLRPRVIAMSWKNFSPELVQKAHRAGAVVFLDLLGKGDNPQGVRQAVAAGVDGVQTDDPDMVLKTLKKMARNK